MNVVLVPGFWLGAWSWAPVTKALVAAGHTVHALTLPGLESPSASRVGITLADHVRATAEVVANCAGDVVLVGHSGGGAIIHAVVDQMPERITRAIYVDSGPLPHGQAINPAIPEVDDELPLPAWDFFEATDLVGLDAAALEDLRARAVPEPAGVARDLQQLSNEARYAVPITVICTSFGEAQLRELMAAGVPAFAELARIENVEIVALPTGHWPQLSRPDDLAKVILAAVDRR